MADWLVSSVAWAAIPQFAVSGVYTLGQFVRPLTAPAFNAQYAFRCTTAGTATTEPNWGTAPANNQTVTTGGATFTNVTGQVAYGWSAAAGNLYCISGAPGFVRASAGDRIFLSSDHNETSANGTYWLVASPGFGVVEVISVNRAGSVPPVAADALSGATIVYNGSGGAMVLDCYTNVYWQGLTLNCGGSGGNLSMASSGVKSHYFKNCALVLSTSATGAQIYATNPCQVTLDNTTAQFNNANQHFAIGSGNSAVELRWINTPSAVLGTAPTTLILGNNSAPTPNAATCRGVDLSAVTGTLYYGASQNCWGKLLFDSCRIASGVVRLGTGGYNTSADEVELVNCYDGTSFLAERHTPAGDVTTEFTITLGGGAQDNVGIFSHKLVSSSRADKFAMTLDGFWMDANYATTGSSKTATVEIVSSGSLNTDDISLVLEYQGTASSSLASFVNTLATIATTPVAVPTSTATWNSLPATPVRQHLQATFTPRTAGRVRAQVRLGKPSTTVYVNPQVTIS